MTNALAILTNGKAELSELEQTILAEIESEETAFDYIPTRIKFPSGGMNVFSTNDGDILKPPFTAIAAVSQKARAFWPGKDTQGTPPLCASPDGVSGYFNTTDREQAKVAAMMPQRHPALGMMAGGEGPHTCATCPLSQWGSGDGKGQACKSLIRLILLVEGWSMPAIMTIPPTSVKVWNGYASARQREKGQAYFTAWTKFDLEMAASNSGVRYGVLKLAVAKPLTVSEIGAVMEIRRQYAQLVRAMGVTAEDYDGSTSVPTGHRVVDAETGEILEGESADALPPF